VEFWGPERSGVVQAGRWLEEEFFFGVVPVPRSG
jgi:hypothetical protein